VSDVDAHLQPCRDDPSRQLQASNGPVLSGFVIGRESPRCRGGTALPAAATAYASGDVVATAFRLAGQSVRAGPEASTVMEGLCWELVSGMAGEKLWPQQRLPSWVRQARELLHDQCTGPIQITQMAQQLGIHPVYFARAFRQAFRCTPGEYRMRCRLRKAMVLLRDAKLPLSDIALEAGFFDQSHLTKAFRNHLGLAPHAYRKQLHGDVHRAEVQFIQDAEGRSA
jgi:AraC family transcriptional regulator